MPRAGQSGRTRPRPPSTARLDELVEEATVDAHDESEQVMGFYTMLENDLTLPFDIEILGVTATVERIDLTEANEIVAICRRGRVTQAIPILSLPLPKSPPVGAEWIEAYRRWARSV